MVPAIDKGKKERKNLPKFILGDFISALFCCLFLYYCGGIPFRRHVAQEEAEAEVSRAQALANAVRMARGQLTHMKKAAEQKAKEEAAAAQEEATKKQVNRIRKKERKTRFLMPPRPHTRSNRVYTNTNPR